MIIFFKIALTNVINLVILIAH